jgi:hypothetical protein
MTEVIIQTAIGTSVSILITVLVYRIYSLRRKNVELSNKLRQADIDKMLIAERLQKTVSEINSTNVEDKDGFIKFLSQSREWAFDYIERVQVSIQGLNHAMESSKEEEIQAAYTELMGFMPEEKNNN